MSDLQSYKDGYLAGLQFADNLAAEVIEACAKTDSGPCTPIAINTAAHISEQIVSQAQAIREGLKP